jgi:tRNA pseudouridine38/39 synthase
VENAKLLSQVSSCQCQQMEVKHDRSLSDSSSLVRRRRVRKGDKNSIPSHLISKRYVALKIMYFGKRYVFWIASLLHVMSLFLIV